MKAYNHLSIEGLTTFYFCGESKEDRLYAVKLQHPGFRENAPWGLGTKAPLGDRPGLFLHSGPSTRTPIAAAAGDEMISPYKYIKNGPNTDTIVIGPFNRNITIDVMRARVTADGKTAFNFQIEVGAGSDMQVEEFSWIKADKGVQNGFKYGGFKLVRHSLETQQTPGNHDSNNPTHPGSSEKIIYNNNEPLALLAHSKPLQWGLSHHMFTLEFTENAFRSDMGDRWRCMVLLTAARIRQMKYSGRTSKAGVELAEFSRTIQICT
ncbi:hypothetical protein HD806DRAFT_525433 [Xylariaceae sp. AK1471]|nr:hypothetical protein HD806DRAFT_525433 [Xylariaceae sp. AK1471]